MDGKFETNARNAVMTKEPKEHKIGTGVKEEVKPLLMDIFKLRRDNRQKICEILKEYLPDELKELFEENTKYPVVPKLVKIGRNVYNIKQFRKTFLGLEGPDVLINELIKMGEILYNMYLEVFCDESTKEHRLPRSVDEFEERIKKVLKNHEKDIDFIGTNPVLASIFYLYTEMPVYLFSIFNFYFQCKYYKEHPNEEYRLDMAPSAIIERIIKQNIWLLEEEKELIKFLFNHTTLEKQVLLLLYTNLFYSTLANEISNKLREWFKENARKKGWDTNYLDPDRVYTKKRFALGKEKRKYDQDRYFEISDKLKELFFDYYESRGIKYIYMG